VLKVAENIEPRILELFPAALLRFPKTFLHKEDIPSDLQQVLTALKQNKDHGPAYQWVAYADMKRWANFTLPDRRTKPMRSRRRTKSFRIRPEIASILSERAKQRGVGETELLEELISGS
jgi:hypothetical protein